MEPSPGLVFGKKTKVEIPINKKNLFYKRLGTDLYLRPEDAFREFVANSRDSKSPRVDINVSDEKYEIEDYGEGIEDYKQFIEVASEEKLSKSGIGHRKLIGNKGIGKMSAFLLADKVLVSSNNERYGCSIGITDGEEDADIILKKDPSSFLKHRGTKLTLTGIKKKVKIDPKSLRSYLSETFLPIILEEGFKITTNGEAAEPKCWPAGTKYKIDIKTKKNYKIKGILVVPEDSEEANKITLYHNGVKVIDSFSIPEYPDLTGWLDEDFLNIKTDRNEYVRDWRFSDLKRYLKNEVKSAGIKTSLELQSLSKHDLRALHQLDLAMMDAGLRESHIGKIERTDYSKITDKADEGRPRDTGSHSSRTKDAGGAYKKKKLPPGFKEILHYPISGFDVRMVRAESDEYRSKAVITDEPSTIYINMSSSALEDILKSPAKLRAKRIADKVMEGVSYLTTKDEKSETFLKNLQDIQTSFYSRSSVKSNTF